MGGGLTDGDAGQLASLLNLELGAGLYSVAGIQGDAAAPDALVSHRVEGGRVVAGAVSRLMVADDVDYYLPFGEAVRDLFRSEPIGSFAAVAVAPAWRGRGLGSGLLAEALAWFRRAGCEAAVAVSWMSGRPGSSAGMFARAGFVAGPIVNNFYLEESITDGWTCPVCRGPCHCAGQLVHLRL